MLRVLSRAGHRNPLAGIYKAPDEDGNDPEGPQAAMSQGLVGILAEQDFPHMFCFLHTAFLNKGGLRTL